MSTDQVTARDTRRRYPCGFCGTRTCGLCPGTIRNARPNGDRTWTCICSEAGHDQAALAALMASPAGVVKVTGLPAPEEAAEPGPAPERDRRPRPSRPSSEAAQACVRCGHEFTKPRKSGTCNSQSACERRQAAKGSQS